MSLARCPGAVIPQCSHSAGSYTGIRMSLIDAAAR